MSDARNDFRPWVKYPMGGVTSIPGAFGMLEDALAMPSMKRLLRNTWNMLLRKGFTAAGDSSSLGSFGVWKRTTPAEASGGGASSRCSSGVVDHSEAGAGVGV